MKVLITGGTGFIGSHTVISLVKEGLDPVIIDNFDNSSPYILEALEKITGMKPSFYNVDCNDAQALDQVFVQEGNIQGVIHFAAHKAVGESVANPLKYYRNNLGSLINLLDPMLRHKVSSLVFSSSCTVYGQPATLPVTETAAVVPAASPYGNTKQVCEEIIRDTVASNVLNPEQSPMNAVLLRYFNPIGAHPSGQIGELPLGVPGNLVPFITQTAAGIRPQLTVFGNDYDTPDGTCIRDYIHVLDLADAHVKALRFAANVADKKGLCEAFNIGTGKGHSVMELVKTFEQVSGLSLNYLLGERRPGDIEQIYASVDKAQQQLGWVAQRSIEEGLRDAWNWQKNLENLALDKA
ncbi:UDP-glucose 4-epimerase GalE [uncultured Microscilla sp.]|uniref:UDP-glucose 4-epimerase GalE n=1 Tax=uncultured Microscilla sp. TaxID=432653 RepID=UPI0026325E13|nr:UDP-glucose 4-epimerase GalE [uncultured Microscilla sp.]